MFIDGPTKGKGWTIWKGKDLCPDHYVNPVEMMGKTETITLWQTGANEYGHWDKKVGEFRKIFWCVTHDSNGMGPSPHVAVACHYSGLFQATLTATIPDSCEFVGKLIEV